MMKDQTSQTEGGERKGRQDHVRQEYANQGRPGRGQYKEKRNGYFDDEGERGDIY